MRKTLYEQFVAEMERSGFKKIFTRLIEKDIELSDNDCIIYVTPKDCEVISIKGIRESTVIGKLLTHPHYANMKIYGYDGNEMLSEDTVQFSIATLRRSGLPTLYSDKWSHTIYYRYPYRTVSSKLKFKKGIVITKNKRLEIRIMREGKFLKIGKLDINMECDKWYKNLSQYAQKVQHYTLDMFRYSRNLSNYFPIHNIHIK